MHQTQWSAERPLPPPVSLTSQSHHEKPPEVTCTSRGTPGGPASTRERPRETFFNTSRGQFPWLLRATTRSPLRSPAQVEGPQGVLPQPEKDLERPSSTRLEASFPGFSEPPREAP